MNSDNRAERYHLRFQDHSCCNCRYMRLHKTGTLAMHCLFLPRILAIGDDIANKAYVQMQRLCDGWKRRPTRWKIWSEGVENNPYLYDPYIPRETQMRLRGEKADDAYCP